MSCYSRCTFFVCRNAQYTHINQSPNILQHSTDYLVLGSGIAGLSFALKAAKTHRVMVLTKASLSDTNTRWAQGGIAAVMAEGDTFEQHIADTLDAGDGLCNEAVVRMVVENAPARIAELLEWGTQFDRNADGSLMLGREGGHTANRILHAKDATGSEIQRALVAAVLNEPNITVLENYYALDFITQHHLGMYVNRGTPNITCYGVYALNEQTRQVEVFAARITVVATGGAGNVYAATTNPPVASGDGIAMAYRAKAHVANMEFNQFHPTALYDPESRPSFLITEALRGKGAVLRHAFSKQEFMHKYDRRGSLAPRDIVARAIDNEMKTAGLAYMLLDATHIPAEELQHEFPTIYAHCLKKGIDISRDMIPVVPASHYLCGGVVVDMDGATSLKNLYGAGECTNSGLHGANRLASNSLLEGIVYAHNIYEATKNRVSSIELKENLPNWDDQGTEKPEEWVLISQNLREVQSLMGSYVGIVRSSLRLERAMRRLDLIYHETEDFYRRTRLSPELCELRNLITIAYLIIKSATIRKESRGLHFTTDYPEKGTVVYDTLL